ncbi:MAG: DUF4286 family protein [Aridibacter famidurans]|nr:DUF4286 family protein [Aridibacter famidurans]
MIHYTVIVEVPDQLVSEFQSYMRRKHIPDVMATGKFFSSEFARSDEGEFRTTYTAESRSALGDYLENYADALRQAFAKEFPHEASVRREVWESIESWSADQS